MKSPFGVPDPSPSPGSWEAQAEANPDSPRHPQPPERRVHLLYSQSEVLLDLFEFLSQAGFQVSASSAVPSAIEYVARVHPEILIAAVEASERGWKELGRSVRLASPGTRLILTSSRLEGAIGEEANQSGISVVAGDPLDRACLLRAVEQALDRSSGNVSVDPEARPDRSPGMEPKWRSLDDP